MESDRQESGLRSGPLTRTRVDRISPVSAPAGLPWRRYLKPSYALCRWVDDPCGGGLLPFDRRANAESESIQVPAGSPHRGPEGDLADAEGNDRHDRHGLRHGDGRRGVLPGRGSGHANSRNHRARDRRMTEQTDFAAMSKRWYIVQAYSNFENKVAESIREQAKQRHLDHLFEEIMVPKEKVVEVRRGRKVDAERKFFPGYVLVKMELSDEAYHLIKNTPKVTGFLGADNKPFPITDAEAQRILHQVQEGIDRPKPSVSFEVGEQVRVSDGPFASFNGTVEEVDDARSRVKVAVSIFGRPTPVELEFGQVEKL